MPDLKRIADILREAIDLLEGDDQQERPVRPMVTKKPWTIPCKKCGNAISFKTLPNGKKCPVNPGTEIPHDCDVTKGPGMPAAEPRYDRPEEMPF